MLLQNIFLVDALVSKCSFSFAVYDSGTIFSPAILDITDDDIVQRFLEVWYNVPTLEICSFVARHVHA